MGCATRIELFTIENIGTSCFVSSSLADSHNDEVFKKAENSIIDLLRLKDLTLDSRFTF